MKNKLFCFPLLTVILALCIPIAGQSKTGTVRGVLTDMQGALLPGALLSIRKANPLEANDPIYAVTDPFGVFTFSNLAFGKYVLEFTTPSFEAGFKKRITITADQPVASNVAFVAEPCGDVDADKAALTDKEMGEIIRQMLQVYLPDETHLKKANLSTENIKPEWMGELKQQFILMTPTEVEKLSQTRKVAYIKVTQLKAKNGCVAANLADLLTLHSDQVLLSGGTKTYEFRKVGDHWVGKILLSMVF